MPACKGCDNRLESYQTVCAPCSTPVEAPGFFHQTWKGFLGLGWRAESAVPGPARHPGNQTVEILQVGKTETHSQCRSDKHPQCGTRGGRGSRRAVARGEDRLGGSVALPVAARPFSSFERHWTYAILGDVPSAIRARVEQALRVGGGTRFSSSIVIEDESGRQEYSAWDEVPADVRRRLEALGLRPGKHFPPDGRW